MIRDQAFVRRIGVGVDQAHTDRLHRGVAQCRRDCIEIGRGRQLDDLACRVGAFGDLDDAIARYGRAWELDLQVVHVVTMLVADQHGVAEPVGRDDSCATDLALDQRVGDQRRGMNDRSGDLRGPHAGLHQQLAHAGAHAIEWRPGGGEGLVDDHPPTGSVDQHHIGERATDVDSQPPVRPDRGFVSHCRRSSRGGANTSRIQTSSSSSSPTNTLSPCQTDLGAR